MPGQSFALLTTSSMPGCREHCECATERRTRPKLSLLRSVWSWDLRHSKKLTRDLRYLKMKSLISKLDTQNRHEVDGDIGRHRFLQPCMPHSGVSGIAFCGQISAMLAFLC